MVDLTARYAAVCMYCEFVSVHQFHHDACNAQVNHIARVGHDTKVHRFQPSGRGGGEILEQVTDVHDVAVVFTDSVLENERKKARRLLVDGAVGANA